MELLFWIFISIGAFLGLGYFLLIASYCYVWIKTPGISNIQERSIFVSIIIVARNEEKNIAACLDAVLAQDYPKEKLEIIVVDDHSTDSTFKIIRSYAEKNAQLKCLQLPENSTGKKQGISFGINVSNGELIVTTDADCKMGIHWLASIVSFYKRSDAKMIVAPVSFYDEITVF